MLVSRVIPGKYIAAERQNHFSWMQPTKEKLGDLRESLRMKRSTKGPKSDMWVKAVMLLSTFFGV